MGNYNKRLRDARKYLLEFIEKGYLSSGDFAVLDRSYYDASRRLKEMVEDGFSREEIRVAVVYCSVRYSNEEGFSASDFIKNNLEKIISKK